MNKHLYMCHPLVLSSPTLMMHGHMNLKFDFFYMYDSVLHVDKVIKKKGELLYKSSD